MATIESTLTLIDNMSGVLQQIRGNVAGLAEDMNNLTGGGDSNTGGNLRTWGEEVEKLGNKVAGFGQQWTENVSKPILALGQNAFTTAAQYESAFTGIKKTVEATPEELEAINQALLDYSSTVTPTSYTELAKIAEMAGQLGVAKNEIVGFTQAYDALQVSSNVAGEEGAKALAQFMNLTEGSSANVARVGGVIVELGNNFATTEAEILSMAQRMASTGHLAGFSSAEILALSATASSLGIQAEAGGSAMGKLMKQMQMAAEVGAGAESRLAEAGYEFESGLDFVNTLATMKKGDVVAMAESMGITSEALKDMGKNWYAMEQFTQLMGVDTSKFVEGWKESPAESMLQFFTALSQLDPEAGNSVLAQLAEMDINEIRLSNLVAAFAGNPEMLHQALQMAWAQYAESPEMNAMMQEAEKFYSTTEALTSRTQNAADNTMANFGENIINMVTPAIEKVNELLTAFNSLSEFDQNAIIAAFAVFAVGGPIVTAVGETVSAIGKISKTIGRMITSFPTWSTKLAAFFQSPITWGVAAGVGIALLVEYVNSLPTKFDEIIAAAKDIKITIDEESYNETISKIDSVKKALEGLKGGETIEAMENESLAVQMGYGSNEMFGSAMTYEAAKTSVDIDTRSAEYAALIAEQNRIIAKAAASGDTATAEAAAAQREVLEQELSAYVTESRAAYTEKINAMFDGMAKEYPEAAATLEKGVESYNLLGMMAQVNDFDYDEAEQVYGESGAEQVFNDIKLQALQALADAGYINQGEIDQQMAGGWVATFEKVSETLASQLNEALQAMSDNPEMASWLGALFSDPALYGNLDPATLNGVLLGMMTALDYQQAAAAASEKAHATGAQIVAGYVMGVNENSGSLSAAIVNMINAALAAGDAAAAVHSPSRRTEWSAEMMVKGYTKGIETNRGDMLNATENLVRDTMDIWSQIGHYAGLEQAQLLGEDEDAIKISDADIKKVRQLAEREIINQFTTAEVHVDFTANNNISSDLDIDGVVDALETRVAERLEAVAEGVYN